MGNGIRQADLQFYQPTTVPGVRGGPVPRRDELGFLIGAGVQVVSIHLDQEEDLGEIGDHTQVET